MNSFADLCFTTYFCFFVLFQNIPACLPNNASNFVNKIVSRIRIFFWIFMSSGSELHLWIPLFEWWEWNGHSYHFYPRRGLKWHGGLFASIVVWKYMVIMLIDPSNHLLFHVTCDYFTIFLLSHNVNFKTYKFRFCILWTQPNKSKCPIQRQAYTSPMTYTYLTSLTWPIISLILEIKRRPMVAFALPFAWVSQKSE